MSDTLGFFTAAISTLFVIVEPFGAVPLFAALSTGRSKRDVQRIALRASVVGAGVLLAFAFGGRHFLELLGIRIDSFRMGGGLLLLLTAIDMLRAKKPSCRCGPEELEDAKTKEDIAVVPLAIPLLAGPGAMAAAMMLMSRASNGWDAAALVVAISLIFVMSWVLLRSASAVAQLLGPSIMAAVQRVLGLVLAAMSIQFIVEGGMNLLRATHS